MSLKAIEKIKKNFFLFKIDKEQRSKEIILKIQKKNIKRDNFTRSKENISILPTQYWKNV